MGKPYSSQLIEDVDVNLQDQHTPPVILPMVLQLGASTVAVEATIGDYTLTVTDDTGFIVGQHIRIINAAADRYYFGFILAVDSNVVTLDCPIDFAYMEGSEVTISTPNMAVNGAVTPVTFVLRTGAPSIPTSIDITRVIVTCIAASTVSLDKFGDLAPLTRGLLFRRVDSVVQNIFNVKTNGELTNIAYDFTVHAASNPNQGIDGFVSRLTFAGQNKIGVTLRVAQDDNLEMIVQDDLTDLTNLRVTLEGHLVDD